MADSRFQSPNEKPAFFFLCTKLGKGAASRAHPLSIIFRIGMHLTNLNNIEHENKSNNTYIPFLHGGIRA
jgi:hypothetical protein